MNRQDQRNRLEELYALVADVETQMEDTTLSHSDQQLLDQAWDAYTIEIDELEADLEADDADTVEWQDAAEYLDSQEEEDDWSPTGPGSVVRNGAVKLVTFAPPPPSSPRLLMPSEDEQLAFANAMVDTRAGCARCAGCAYCEESSPYDGTDEL